jgi:hypothetical protein
VAGSTWAGGDNANLTKANLLKVKRGSKLNDAEGALGAGTETPFEEVRKLTTATGTPNKFEQDDINQLSRYANQTKTTKWYVWQNGGTRLALGLDDRGTITVSYFRNAAGLSEMMIGNGPVLSWAIEP